MRQFLRGVQMATRSRRSQYGQAIIEFILILPLLLVVVAAVWEYGRVFDAQLVVTNAAREGARFASTNGSNTNINLASQVTNRVEQYAVTGFGNRLKSFEGQTKFNGLTFNPNGDVTIDSVSVCYVNDLIDPTACQPAPGQQLRVIVTVRGTVRVFMPFLPGLSDPYHMSASTTMLMQ